MGRIYKSVCVVYIASSYQLTGSVIASRGYIRRNQATAYSTFEEFSDNMWLMDCGNYLVMANGCLKELHWKRNRIAVNILQIIE